jgi:hypothetical protein
MYNARSCRPGVIYVVIVALSRITKEPKLSQAKGCSFGPKRMEVYHPYSQVSLALV